MQWEQVLSDHDVEGYSRIKENNSLARNAVHLSWGPLNKKRLVSLCGVPEKNVIVTGNVAMDFLRPEYRSYYGSREDICREFGLDASKEIVMFISSFAYLSIKEEDFNDERYKALGYDVLCRIMKDASIKSQKTLLEWFDKALKNDTKHEFVYRPHPGEMSNETLLKFEREHDNFHIITNYSVKQWILTADKLYTWVSTSIIEAYMAKRHCMIIRPYEIPRQFDTEIYHDSEMITSYDEFIKSFSSNDCRADHFSFDKFPIPEKAFDDFFSIDEKIPTYKRMCDIFEDIYKNDRYIIKNQEKIQKKKYSLKKRTVILVRRYASVSPFLYLLSKINKNSKIASVVKNNRENRLKYKKGIASKAEIESTEQKISKVFY